MAANGILPFATGTGANALDDLSYAEADFLQQGFQRGELPSLWLNKVLRQSTAVASGFGQFTADYSGLAFNDSLSPLAMRDNFRLALAASLDGARMGVDTSTQANQITFPLVPLPTSLNKLVVWFKPINTNTGPTTAQIAGGTFPALPVKRSDGADVVSGDLPANVWRGAICDGSRFTLLALTKSEIQAIIAAAGSGSSGNAVTGPITGFVPAGMTGTATSAAMTVGAGACADSTGVAAQKQASALNWSVTNGNAANGFQGGTTLPNSATIHMFYIWGANGGAAFASTSLTPTIPSGYAYYRRIFSFTTTSGGAPNPISAVETAGGGLTCFLATPVLDVNGLLIPYTTRGLFATSAPAGISVEWLGNGFTQSQNNTNPNPSWVANLTSPLEPDTSVATSLSGSISGVAAGNPIPDTYASTGGGRPADFPKRRIFTDTSGQLGIRGSAATSSNMALYLSTYGWGDGRRA